MRTSAAGVLIVAVLAFMSGVVVTYDNDAQAAPAPRGVVLSKHDLQVMRLLLARTCSLQTWEDGSGRFDRRDDERFMCLEVVSQIGR